MDHPVFTGSSAAIVTPFAADGPDLHELRRLLEFQISSGTAAITVCGTTGEASAMTRSERLRVVEAAVRFTDGRVPVIAGVGSNDTSRAVGFALDAKSAGADALLAVTPYYNKTTQDGLVAYYETLADAAAMPVIAYNVPSRTGMTIRPETYERISRHPYLAGTKEASGSVRLVGEILHRCRPGFTVWSGSDSDTVAFLAMGAKGVISVAANVVPRLMAEMTALARAGDFRAASEIQRRLLPLDEALFSEVNPIPVKEAVRLLGYGSGLPRPPLVPCPPDITRRLREELEALGAF